MIYVLQSGSYSDFAYRALIEAPEDLDFEEMKKEAEQETHELSIAELEGFARQGDTWAAKEVERNTNYRSDIAATVAWVHAFERRGGKELPFTAVHYGAYTEADLLPHNPADYEDDVGSAGR